MRAVADTTSEYLSNTIFKKHHPDFNGTGSFNHSGTPCVGHYFLADSPKTLSQFSQRRTSVDHIPFDFDGYGYHSRHILGTIPLCQADL